jgi:transcription elongation factor Elf1
LNKIDTQYQAFLVCPYCGYIDRDSWEHREDEGSIECGSCNKSFNYARDVSVTYSTWDKDKNRYE